LLCATNVRTLAAVSIDPSTHGVAIWTTFLAVTGVFNICLWLFMAARLARSKSALGPRLHAVRRRQLLLSLLFVLGCAFRSFIPRADVQRICFHDAWFASVAVGRSVATVAELAFIGQWAFLLYEAARASGRPTVTFISRLLVPLIAVAELFSWYAVLTTNYFGNVLEESTWTVVSALVLASFAMLWFGFDRRRRSFLEISFFLLSAYLIFMCTTEVPMYISRYRADRAAGRTATLTLADGLQDCWQRRVVTHRWDDWRDEIPWMSLYFSTGVWVSLSLVRAPDFESSRDQNVAVSSLSDWS
jgi:hypothetical protein